MTQEDYRHPIAPPRELVQQWVDDHFGVYVAANGFHKDLATRAAQWGADQELEACCALLNKFNEGFWCEELRAARRPKPPSLKEQALMALEDGDTGPGASLTYNEVSIIRRALEHLDD